MFFLELLFSLHAVKLMHIAKAAETANKFFYIHNAPPFFLIILFIIPLLYVFKSTAQEIIMLTICTIFIHFLYIEINIFFMLKLIRKVGRI